MGAGEPGLASNFYGASDVTVTKGATVTWQANWFESHSVTFTNPPPPAGVSPTAAQDLSKTYSFDGSAYLTSGLYNTTSAVKAFKVTFPKAGNYTYFCAIHPAQTGIIRVIEAGAGTPTTQAQIDATARRVFADDLAELRAGAAKAASVPVTQTRNADGTTTWKTVGVGGKVYAASPSDYMAFYPDKLSIKVGDTVTWHSDVSAPHTVTFLAGKPMPVGPAGTAPSPAQLPSTYDGSDLLNSGAFGLGRGTQDFTLKFTKAGTYTYICVPHVAQGMGGTIVVEAAAAQGTAVSAPPKTGTAGPADRGASTLAIASLAILAVAVIFGTRRSIGSRR